MVLVNISYSINNVEDKLQLMVLLDYIYKVYKVIKIIILELKLIVSNNFNY